MTVHVDKIKPFLGEVEKSWLTDEPSSDVRELPERADEETLVKAPNTEPVSGQRTAKSANNELIDEPEPEEESALSSNFDHEVNSTRQSSSRKAKTSSAGTEIFRRICMTTPSQWARELLERSTIYYCNEQ